jgi:hypothetical protein
MGPMATLVPVFAHAGHWLEGVFFLPPSLLVIVAIVRSQREQRAARRAAVDGAQPTRRARPTPDAGREST